VSELKVERCQRNCESRAAANSMHHRAAEAQTCKTEENQENEG